MVANSTKSNYYELENQVAIHYFIMSMTKAYWTYRISVANHERVQVQKCNDKHESLGEPSGIFRYQDKLAEITPMLATTRFV
jgi:hypothetical protein